MTTLRRAPTAALSVPWRGRLLWASPSTGTRRLPGRAGYGEPGKAGSRLLAHGGRREPAAEQPATLPTVAGEAADRWRELGNFIREQRSLSRLSLRRLSELSGISNPYLSQIERGLRKPSAEILQQVARALHISAERLYVEAGILDRTSRADDLVRHIEADPHLSEEHKRALIRIYRSFRMEHERLEASATD